MRRFGAIAPVQEGQNLVQRQMLWMEIEDVQGEAQIREVLWQGQFRELLQPGILREGG